MAYAYILQPATDHDTGDMARQPLPGLSMPNSRQKERVPPIRCSGFYSHTETAGNQRQPLGFQRKQLGPDVLCHDGAKQRVGIGIVNSNRQRLANLSAVAVEHHNTVAHRPASEL